MPQKLSPEPQTVKLIRKARRLSSASVAQSAKLSPDLLQAVESQPTELSSARVLALAKALAVPPQFLFHREIEIEENLPDFRTQANRPAVLTSAGLSKVQRARSIIAYLDDDIFGEDEKRSLVGTVSLADGVESAAKALQRYFSPVKRADGTVDPVGTFRETRVAIEKKGAIVLCDRVANDSFRGFCFSERGHFPLILINTAGQRPATKLFTLMHEIVHILLGRTGVSDPTVLENKVEQFCNRVTATVMMPAASFSIHYHEIDSNNVRRVTDALAHRYGVSKTAAALRITELGLSKDFYRRWLGSLPAKVPPIEEEDEGDGQPGGGGIPAQIGRFGYLLPKVLGKAIEKKSISVFDAYRLTNLKPKTFGELARIGEQKLEL